MGFAPPPLPSVVPKLGPSSYIEKGAICCLRRLAHASKTSV